MSTSISSHRTVKRYILNDQDLVKLIFTVLSKPLLRETAKENS